MMHVVVDGANVVGSRPDGWWHDRPGAARRLATQLVAALRTDPAGLAGTLTAGSAELTLHLVLEGAAARATDLPRHPQLIVLTAPADGDSAIAALVDDLVGVVGAGTDEEPAVLVVTADRVLRDRVRAAGASTVGPGTLLRVLG
jgi:hypothetical protein